MRTLLIEHQPEGTALALMRDRLLTDYRVISEARLRVETVMIGRVRQNVRGMGAAFISLPDGQVGFLAESEARQPLHPGDFLLVQVKKPPTGTKGAYLTQEISLAGQGLVLLPLSTTIAISSRIEDESQREKLLSAARSLRPDGMGLIMRRQALAMDETGLRHELDRLIQRWQDISAQAGEPGALRTLWHCRSAMEQAQLVIAVIDASGPVTQEDIELVRLAEEAPKGILVFSKMDLSRNAAPVDTALPVLSLSAVTGEGLDRLEEAIKGLFPMPQVPAGEILTNSRQAEAIGRALDSMKAAKEAMLIGATPDIVLTETETAMAALGELSGRTVREDITNRIFERFCVGK